MLVSSVCFGGEMGGPIGEWQSLNTLMSGSALVRGNAGIGSAAVPMPAYLVESAPILPPSVKPNPDIFTTTVPAPDPKSAAMPTKKASTREGFWYALLVLFAWTVLLPVTLVDMIIVIANRYDRHMWYDRC